MLEHVNVLFEKHGFLIQVTIVGSRRRKCHLPPSPAHNTQGFNSLIIINDHPFAYPDCRFGVGVKAARRDKVFVITNPISSFQIPFI